MNRLVTLRVLHRSWKNLDVKLDQFLDNSHFGGTYMSTQLSTKAFAIIPDGIFVRGMVLTTFESRSMTTNRNRILSLNGEPLAKDVNRQKFQ